MAKKFEKKKKIQNTASNAQKFLIESSNRFSVLEEKEKNKENTDDWISSLPNEILFRIISFLPFQSAVNSRALSVQWNNMWLWNETLIKHGYQADIAPAITEFLNQFNALDSLKKFWRLEFHFCKYQILLASVGLNWKLHLDFSEVKDVLGEFWQFSQVQQLQDLRSFIHKLSPSLSFVKALKLTSVNYYPTSDRVTWISNLELLESLVIKRCNAVRYICVRDVPKLQNIIVLDCPQLIGLHIEASELGSLRIRGKLIPCIRFLGNFSLKDAMLDIREGPDLECECFPPLLRKIRFVKVLTLCRWTFETICKNWPQTMQFHCLKDLWWIESSVKEQNIDALLSFLKICPSLERLFITIDPTSCGMRSTIDKPPSNGRVYKKRSHLKVVKLENLAGEDVIFLADILLKAIFVEKLVVVVSDGNYLRSLEMIPVKRTTQKGKCYKLVEDFEDNNGQCLKHAHMGL